MFRPQAARLRRPADAALADSIALAGVVTHREFLGSTFRYQIRAPGTRFEADAPYAHGQPTFEIGEAVALDVPWTALRFVAT